MRPDAINQDLVAFYPFAGTSLDASGNGNDCVSHGAKLADDRHGNPNSAYYLDGSSYLECGNDESVRITGPMTLAAWFNPDAASLSGPSPVLVGKLAYPNQFAYDLYIQDRDGLCPEPAGIGAEFSQTGMGAVPEGTACNGDDLVAGQWYHAAAVFTPGESVIVYLNGLPVGEQLANGVVSTIFDSTAPLTMGWNGGTYYQGALDDVRVYSKPLTEAEVASLFQSR